MRNELKKILDVTEEDLANIQSEMAVSDDFYIELDNGECYRFINNNEVYDTFHEECKELIQDCYELEGIPSFIKIDWQATTDECLSDGLGHHFSHYDGSHEEVTTGEHYHIFRTD